MGEVEIPETGVCEDGRKKGLKSDHDHCKVVRALACVSSFFLDSETDYVIGYH